MLINRIKLIMVGLLAGMLAVRSGIFVVRMAKDWDRPVSRWQPANEIEQMIWENYRDLDSGSGPE